MQLELQTVVGVIAVRKYNTFVKDVWKMHGPRLHHWYMQKVLT